LKWLLSRKRRFLASDENKPRFAFVFDPSPHSPNVTDTALKEIQKTENLEICGEKIKRKQLLLPESGLH
jgi:hypothetical protein